MCCFSKSKKQKKQYLIYKNGEVIPIQNENKIKTESEIKKPNKIIAIAAIIFILIVLAFSFFSFFSIKKDERPVPSDNQRSLSVEQPTTEKEKQEDRNVKKETKKENDFTRKAKASNPKEAVTLVYDWNDTHVQWAKEEIAIITNEPSYDKETIYSFLEEKRDQKTKLWKTVIAFYEKETNPSIRLLYLKTAERIESSLFFTNQVLLHMEKEYISTVKVKSDIRLLEQIDKKESEEQEKLVIDLFEKENIPYKIEEGMVIFDTLLKR